MANKIQFRRGLRFKPPPTPPDTPKQIKGKGKKRGGGF